MRPNFSGRKIREVRGDRPVEEIALAAGVTAASIRNWESGRYQPDASALARIAAHLGVSMEILFEPERAA